MVDVYLMYHYNSKSRQDNDNKLHELFRSSSVGSST